MVRPKIINTVCAHPTIVCWVIGAMVLDAGLVLLVAHDSSGFSSLCHTETAIWLLLGLVPSTVLGFWLGVFTCFPVVVSFCLKMNGAPFFVGDQVLILAGPHKGVETTVYAITLGQGGETVLQLDLGPEMKANYKDLFAEYSVLNLARR